MYKSNNKQISSMFPIKNIEYSMNTRKTEEYHVNMAKTDRHKNSAIPYVQMQRLHNKNM